ncbi:hypothetical protein [Streptomyces sp. NPDC001404]|uniref:hypothetical protein n=1 Tax=Streptomyces sp. NPDC001404 TaxID=3364571 RepID=UPI00368BBC41
MPKYEAADAKGVAVHLLDEYAVAQVAGDHARMTGLMLAAIELDQRCSGGQRLMDEIRAMRRGGRR